MFLVKEPNSFKFKMYDKRKICNHLRFENCAFFLCVIHSRPYLELSKGHKILKANLVSSIFPKYNLRDNCKIGQLKNT